MTEQPAKVPHDRILYADLLRIVAIATVVNLHVASGMAGQFGSIRTDWWWIGNAYNSLSRWSVPVFLMLSGMLILGHSSELPIGAFLKKRFLRVFVPYAFWALLVYVPWKTIGLQQPFSLQQTVSEFLRGSTYYHLWFVWTIMNVYLLVPVLRILVKHAGNRIILYLIGLWFANLTLTTLFEKFLNITLGLSVEMAKGFVGYVVLGYYLDKTDVPRRYRAILYALAAASAVITIWATGALSIAKGSLDDFFYSYLVPTTILIAAAVFLVVRNVDWPPVFTRPAAASVIAALSAASFGIYFVHPIVLSLLQNGALGVRVSMTSFDSPLVGIPLTTLATFALSFLIVQAIRAVPYGKIIAP